MRVASCAEGATCGFLAENERLHQLKQLEGRLTLFRHIMQEDQDYLSQVSTQAALIATAACAMLGSKEQIIFKETRLCDVLPESVSHQWVVAQVCKGLDGCLELSYVMFAAVSFGLSLSIVYGAMNLVNMMKAVTIEVRDGSGLERVEPIVSLHLAAVRKRFVLAIAFLLLAIVTMMLEVSDYYAFPTIGVISLIALHAKMSDRSMRTDIAREVADSSSGDVREEGRLQKLRQITRRLAEDRMAFETTPFGEAGLEWLTTKLQTRWPTTFDGSHLAEREASTPRPSERDSHSNRSSTPALAPAPAPEMASSSVVRPLCVLSPADTNGSDCATPAGSPATSRRAPIARLGAICDSIRSRNSPRSATAMSAQSSSRGRLLERVWGPDESVPPPVTMH